MDSMNESRCRELLISIRKIIQAIDIHSRMLNKRFGLTGPQLIVMQEIASHGQISITPLSKATSLRQATVTDITQRLEAKGYISRKKNKEDKRATSLFLTDTGKKIIEQLPPLLQEEFTERFSSMANWEQLMILSAFERVVSLMSAEEIDASPVLVTGLLQKGIDEG